MDHQYTGVISRFLRQNERFIPASNSEMPLVIEPQTDSSTVFLKTFLSNHSTQILEDLSTHGAVLLRGFDIHSEADFESSVLSIHGIQGIHEAFMSEEGRVPVGDLKYVLHTNAVYKTGGTLYLGGFHSENYYSSDVPSTICFYCKQPSTLGGETGLVNMQKVYPSLDDSLKAALEKNTFFVSQWLVSDVAGRYQLTIEQVRQIAKRNQLSLVGEGPDELILLYKPNIFTHPANQAKALQINLFEIDGLNEALRRCFMDDYAGNTWFWHRFIWKSPRIALRILETIYIAFASFFYSPKDAIHIFLSKRHMRRAMVEANHQTPFSQTKVGSCFKPHQVQKLAESIRENYASFLWKKGDILLVDNRQVMHAGMPGAGPRLVRAMITNPLEMPCMYSNSGAIDCKPRRGETIGAQMVQASEEEMLGKATFDN